LNVDLVIFDIDGTLTATNAVDTRCLARAYYDVFGIEISTTWHDYPHRTDSGIIASKFRQRLNRGPSMAELDLFKKRFFALLKAAWLKAPWDFAEIAGAGKALRLIDADGGYALVLATGGFRVSARFKLEKARLPTAKILAAYADDAEAREEIVSVAIARASFRYQRSFARTILVGDSDCDVATATRLGLSFVGIAAEGQETLLLAAGAETETILSDYREVGKLLIALQSSVPPMAIN
jgi:beta-phosphoglucomutase-like phosphatase (HAD superfamily)